ncbi:MAG: hypothetical protein J6W92_01535 [Paludibacteraceae bacterium]|nr:hypothetical protein [Paludibacteraceae bacterium]
MKLIYFISHLMMTLYALGSEPRIEQTGNYFRIAMSESCTWEVIQYGNDSALVVQTDCAPICSSCARVYNKQGVILREITPPFEHAVFPYATIVDGEIRWEDHTSELLDDEERAKA